MAKRPPPGKCVHCLRDKVIRTWDHVFPKSWYPTTTPPNVAKWKIPACKQCNGEYGSLEADLKIRFALCLDPDDPDHGSLVQDGLRALNPAYARNERDRGKRIAKARQLQREFRSGADVPAESIYPNFEEKWNRPPDEQTGILLPAGSLRRVAEKIARGVFYLEDGRFIEPPYVVEFSALADEAAKPIMDLLSRFGKVYAREPGIVITRAVVPADGLSSALSIEIWRRLRMYVAIHREDW